MGAPPTAQPEGGSREMFLRALFQLLDEYDVRYVVMHSWENLPQELPSDLDLGIDPRDRDKLRRVFQILTERGYPLVQSLNYFVGAYYFVFLWRAGLETRAVALDIIFEHRRSGVIAPEGRELAEGRRREGILWTPAPATEFVYLLAKKAWKGRVPARQSDRLAFLATGLGKPEAQKQASRIFPGKLGKDVAEACLSGDIDAVLKRIRGTPWLTSAARNPLRLAWYSVTEGWRRSKRWLQPTGLLVILTGGDQPQRDAFAAALVEAVGQAFRRHRTLRCAESPIGQWVDYGATYRRLLARSGLVVLDCPKDYRGPGDAHTIAVPIGRPLKEAVAEASGELIERLARRMRSRGDWLRPQNAGLKPGAG